MTDAFALLNQPRRPWVEVEALKETFLTRSTETHPDKFTNHDEKAAARLQRPRPPHHAHTTHLGTLF